MPDLFPGGYVFSTLIVWTVIAIVIVGTSLVPTLLVVGAVLMLYEAVTGKR